MIVRICRGLDGIPLAIELAAARTNSLSVEEINDCLVQRFSLLSGGSRTGSHRHRTLTALIDWSHDLLSIREKALFRRVSVFAGGWSLESAQRVCAGSGIEASETREVLSALVEKSLVIMEPGEEGRSRYRLLETVREYARERVIAAGEECELRARHLDYFFSLAEEADAHRDDKEHKERWLARLKIEHQNLLVGLDWCKSRPERAEAGLRLATSMASFWTMNGLLTEGRACLDDALAHGKNVSPCVRARALHENALLAWHKQDLPTAAFNAEESLRLRRALGDASVLAETLGAAGMVARDMHDFDRARVFFEEALAIHRVREDRYGIAGAFHALGVTAHMQGDLRTARTLYEDGLAIRRERGGITMGYSLGCLCWLHCDIGDYAASRSHHLEALSIFRAHDFDFGIAWCLELHAGLSVVRGQWEKGAILYGAAEALASRLELSMPLTITEGYFALVKAARAELGEEVFAAAWSKGLAMRRDESISFSLDDS
jgi:non-specific serine/threonine protein kinase